VKKDEPDGHFPNPLGENRLRRKVDHLELALTVQDGPLNPGFSDVHLIHSATPVADLPDVHLDTAFWGRGFSSPFLVDAMTGGPAASTDINAAVSAAAGSAGWGMAVGSQQAALDDGEAARSFEVVRERNPRGWVMANLSAGADSSAAARAVDMISADTLQLHLNPVQELLMSEGDRSFGGILEAVESVVENCPVPVMVKEVGFGLSAETVRGLLKCGVHSVNVAGAGGTNFAAIEISRDESGRGPVAPRDFLSWGIPTVPSLLETLDGCGDCGVVVVASGGVRSPLDAIKALVLGADLVSVTRPVWKVLHEHGAGALENYLKRWNEDARRLLLLLGATRISDVPSLPYVITGQTAEFLRGRGHPTART